MFSNEKLNLENGEERLKYLSNYQLPETRFNFLNDHFGLRPGCMHVLLGTAGHGKSTVTRAIVDDMARTEKIIFLSTEEKKEDFELQYLLNKAGTAGSENIKFFHEQKSFGFDVKNPPSLVDWEHAIKNSIQNSEAKVLFFDNLTSSILYNTSPQTQANMVFVIKQIIEDLKIPAFVLCHTKKGIKSSDFFSSDDVKGSTQIGITAEFFYAFNRFVQSTTGDDIQTGTMRVLKSRGYRSIGNCYELSFDHATSSYVSDRRVKGVALEKLVKNRSKIL